MLHAWLANAVVVLHALFVVFVFAGGFLVWRWPRLAWLHLPAAAWGAVVEFTGWICPLTPLEIWLRTEAGADGYTGGFVQHYVEPILYPPGLTPGVQWILGAAVVGVNLFAYGRLWLRRRREKRSPG